MTDTTKYQRLADLSIWKARDGKSWIVWIDNGEYPCDSFETVMDRIKYNVPDMTPKKE